MDLNLTPQEEEFRQQVRNWLAQNRPVALHQRGEVDGKTWVQRAKDWQRRLYEAGYLALSWPKEYGGQALDPMRQAIVNEELMRAGVPGVVGSNSISMLGPTLITWGTEEQKRRYLPKILTAEEIWCQGYSEPGAGSDLASLRTRAELRGDEFVVNGQKVWTSGAHIADMMFGLVRTNPDAPKHQGHLLPAGRHAIARPHGASAGADERRSRFLRGLFRQRPGAARQSGRRAARRMEGRQHHDGA